ncbi:unnamed protein product [Rangifer tarandus platyrhynchus]|uniref:Uncharacterized protein n=2 Tax=Rangifer tarandus platyrhynchus TaxID=3082113 RepID=A0ABN8ZYQ7_RANTA|nr:unnamed protein product [Rangifer tarandus platyrhynchus]CAI9713655.1 unnamed protein product [Rangifer tarandus platyrhynchus]
MVGVSRPQSRAKGECRARVLLCLEAKEGREEGRVTASSAHQHQTAPLLTSTRRHLSSVRGDHGKRQHHQQKREDKENVFTK